MDILKNIAPSNELARKIAPAFSCHLFVFPDFPDNWSQILGQELQDFLEEKKGEIDFEIICEQKKFGSVVYCVLESSSFSNNEEGKIQEFIEELQKKYYFTLGYSQVNPFLEVEEPTSLSGKMDSVTHRQKLQEEYIKILQTIISLKKYELTIQYLESKEHANNTFLEALTTQKQSLEELHKKNEERFRVFYESMSDDYVISQLSLQNFSQVGILSSIDKILENGQKILAAGEQQECENNGALDMNDHKEVESIGIDFNPDCIIITNDSDFVNTAVIREGSGRELQYLSGFPKYGYKMKVERKQKVLGESDTEYLSIVKIIDKNDEENFRYYIYNGEKYELLGVEGETFELGDSYSKFVNNDLGILQSFIVKKNSGEIYIAEITNQLFQRKKLLHDCVTALYRIQYDDGRLLSCNYTYVEDGEEKEGVVRNGKDIEEQYIGNGELDVDTFSYAYKEVYVYKDSAGKNRALVKCDGGYDDLSIEGIGGNISLSGRYEVGNILYAQYQVIDGESKGEKGYFYIYNNKAYKLNIPYNAAISTRVGKNFYDISLRYTSIEEGEAEKGVVGKIEQGILIYCGRVYDCLYDLDGNVVPREFVKITYVDRNMGVAIEANTGKEFVFYIQKDKLYQLGEPEKNFSFSPDFEIVKSDEQGIPMCFSSYKGLYLRTDDNILQRVAKCQGNESFLDIKFDEHGVKEFAKKRRFEDQKRIYRRTFLGTYGKKIFQQ